MRFFRDLAGCLLVIGLAAAPAFAAQGGEGDNTGCNGQGNPNSPCTGGTGGNGGNGGNGGAGGTASAAATAIAAGGTGIGVGIGKGGTATGVGSVEVNQTIQGDRTEIPAQAPAVFAPNLTASPEACMGSTSVGGSAGFASISLGISVGSTWKNHDCELRAFSREIGSLGPTFTPVRIALLSQNDDVKKAFQDAGVEIPTPKKAAAMIQPPTAAAYAPAPIVVQGGVQIEKRNVSPEPAQVICRDGELKIKAGNGEYFCRAR